ncbi:MAG TPA: prepilin-type N-terminal cleavage/methylation domain-containing protein [Candidatus Saccharimonadales bacterium]|nr:prepilin-type N-terminal cleavage/methylation domain-containing protein [Candidatus Saccharimonadales bacterium]
MKGSIRVMGQGLRRERLFGRFTLGERQAGFTIVELMIATLVFSIVLLIITVGVLHFSNSYYKGINSSATQTAAQSAIDTISQAVQFGATGSAGTDVAPSGVFCAGSQMFLYSLGVEYTGGTPNSSNWGLYMFPNPHTGNCDTSGIVSFAGGSELLSTNMRVTDITVVNSDPTTNLWNISLTVAYGDSDLLCNTSIAAGTQGSCDNGSSRYATTDTVTGDDVGCHTDAGTQFCSVASLSTVAQQRVVGN